MRSPSTYDHLRPVDADCPDGTYRVVGTGDESVTLLLVADAEGRRRHTGELITVDADAMGTFEAAENPDGNRSAASAATDRLPTVYWEVRAFLHELVVAPLPTAVGGLAIVAGLQGMVPLPSELQGGLILAGSLLIAVVGSGFYRRIR